MLACNETITLVHHMEEQDADSYTCTVIHGASWFGKTKVALQEHGLAAAKETKIRIPTENIPEGIAPQEGDFMVRGEIVGITKPADLQPLKHIRIMAVGDNRRGRLPHWAVMGQ